jgi:hypothetical protein
VSGDINPIHLDERRAEASPLRRVVGHSLWGGGGLISALLGTRLPGPGTAYVAQELHFLRARRRARALHPPDQPSEESDYADARSSEHADLLARIAALSASAP